MRTLKCQAMILCIASIAVAGFGEAGESDLPLRLAVEMTDGSRLIGIPAVTSVPIATVVGEIAVPLAQVATLTFRGDNEGVTVALANGDRLSGVHGLGEIRLTTLFGDAVVEARFIRRITVIGVSAGIVREGLKLWNRLESEVEVRESSVGPGGMRRGGRFVAGRFGQGIELNMQEQFGVTFPADVVSGPAGCIEFWAKLVDFPSDLAWGVRPGLIGLSDEEGSSHLMLLHFNGNDGQGNGGLCVGVEGLAHAGTGPYGQWTYTRALGAGAVGDWRHYALVWATDGIPGVDNGTRKVASYVDGKLNSGVWNGIAGNSRLPAPATARLGLLYHHGLQGGRAVFDNLKVWSYPKTDFSDRTDE